MEDRQVILKGEDDAEEQLGEGSSRKAKMPRRIIYFASGESMEDYSTEEEDVEENNNETLLDTANLPWVSFLRLWVFRIATATFFTCEFLGGKLATLFGLTESKYQYAIDEYQRTQEKGSESDEDSEEMPEASDAPNEEKHLQMESLNYGSIISPEHTVVSVNEVGERACISQENP